MFRNGYYWQWFLILLGGVTWGMAQENGERYRLGEDTIFLGDEYFFSESEDDSVESVETDWSDELAE
ncbi:MAG: hypothetical protein Q4E67_07220, partial [Planctomycetia bacterium]|nr:hypothetical protein [Planctomycetia bacterium]